MKPGRLKALEQRVRNIYSSKKEWTVNTFAPMALFQPLFIANEYYIAGSETYDIIKTRALNIAVSSILNHPLIKSRNRINKHTG